MKTKEYNKAVESFSGQLYRFSVKMMKNQDDANDIVQDSFMKLWENKSKIEFKKAKSWLFTTAYNGSINNLKKQNRSVSIETTNYNEPYCINEEDYKLKELINKSIDTLPTIQKSILLLRDLEGYSYKEIGEILKLKESQVKVYLFRGRKMIKNQLTAVKAIA